MSQWTSSFSLIGPTGPAGSFAPATTYGDYVYYDGTTWTTGSTIISIGSGAGQTSQGAAAIALGQNAGNNSQSASAVAIGDSAGRTNQGLAALAFGGGAGYDTQGAAAVAVGNGAGNQSQGENGLAFGNNAGFSNQGANSVAIGNGAGCNVQGIYAIALGNVAGGSNQGSNAIAIGVNSGFSTQGVLTVAVGNEAGYTNQLNNAIAVGARAGFSNQGGSAIAIGNEAGLNYQGYYSIAIGNAAGQVSSLGAYGIAIGYSAAQYSRGKQFTLALGHTAGYSNQDIGAVAIGFEAARSNQGANAIGIGNNAGNLNQGQRAIAFGYQTGNGAQSSNAIAIGTQAGCNAQGVNSIAIGNQAGYDSQSSNSIVLNASNAPLTASTIGLYINPIREVEPANQFGLFYDTTSKEVIYNSIITISSFSTVVVAGNIVPDRTEAYTLGTSSLRYKSLFVGPGSINIAGPSNTSATIGTDVQGIVYTESGFATPFVNIGPEQLTPQAVGGWQIGPTGTQGVTGYDLTVRELQANGSGPTGPSYSLIHPVATAKGNLITVDSVYGDDSFGTPGLYPYKTVNAAMVALAASGSFTTVVINPGNYTLSAPITLPAGTSVRGISLQTCKISYTATTDTTMVTMGENSRIEDLNISLTSSSDVDLIGIGFPGQTAQTAKVRTCVVTVDNRSATTSKTVSGVLFNGTNVPSTSDFSFNALKGSTVNVYSNSSGRVRGVLAVESSIISTRDMNFYVSSFSVQSDYIAIETLSTAIVQLRSSSVSGTTADISQTTGSIQIGPGTDLINRTANGKTFSTSVYPTTIFYGLKGDISNMTSSDGWLWPGTVGIQKAAGGNPAYPDAVISYFRIQQPAILWGMTTDAATPTGLTHSTIFIAYVSTASYVTATPTSFILGYGDGDVGVKNNYSQSVSLKTGDQIALYVSTSGALNTNTMHDITVQLDLF